MDILTSTSRDLALDPSFYCGVAETIESVNRVLSDVAPTDIPVLLIGESGTGKDAYARLIHRLYGGNHDGFQKLSCATANSTELFSRVRRFFEPQERIVNAKKTLLLDGIDDFDLACQRVLLALLPESTLEGDELAEGARLVCSSTKNLELEVSAGRFRRELYFRISGVCIHLPRLRERKSDIIGFLEHFLQKNARIMKKTVPDISPEAEQILLSYEWPGNVRELENIAKKMVALADAMSALSELKDSSANFDSVRAIEDSGTSLKLATREAARQTERALILKALERTHWNRKRAAQDLKVSYKSLLYKIKRIGLDEGDQPRERANENKRSLL